MNLKKWDWLVPVLILAIILPGCPYPPKVLEMEEGWIEIPAPRYESKIYLGEPLETEDEKGSVNYLDRTHYRVSVGSDLLEMGSDPLGQGSYTLIDGRYLEPDTTWYLEPWAVIAKNEKAVKDVRIIEFSRKMWQRNGPWPHMTVSDPDLFDGTVRYKGDKPDKPQVDGDHNDGSLIRRFFGAVGRIGAVLINGWLLKETLQTLGCFLFNHTIGLGGVGMLPAWCVNVPGFKSGEEVKSTGFDQRMVYSLEEADAKDLAKQYRGWLEMPLTKRQVVKYQWAVTYVLKSNGQPAEIKNLSGIIAMDTDGDGIPDDWEIDNGTDPDDPNDPGNEPATIPTPNLVGQIRSEAEDILDDLDFGLELNPVTPVPSDAPINTVLSQSPDSGVLIGRNSDIAVTISDGSGYGMMPIPCEFEGQTGPEWVTILHNAGFNNLQAHYIYCVGSPDCEDPAGWTQAGCNEVYAIDWNCGDMAASDFELHYWVKKCIDPDDYYNRSQATVVAELQFLGFHVEVGAPQAHPTVPAGNVFSVTVRDCDVLICVSTGPGNPNPLTVTISHPADNFVGTVGQQINFTAMVSGGVTPYVDFKWHFPDNSFKYQQNVTKTFDIPGAGWVYFDVTDSAGTTVQDKIWIQINS